MNKKSFSTLVLACCMLLFSSATAFAIEADYLTDEGIMPLGDMKPGSEWDWDDGNYYSEFGINQYTYTARYFTPNDSNIIYYTIGKSASCDKTGAVETWCLECDKCLTTYDFSITDDLPADRKVTLSSSHNGHHVFFKIILNSKLFDKTKFEGYISIRLER